MRYDSEHKARTRERVLKEAAAAIRRNLLIGEHVLFCVVAGFQLREGVPVQSMDGEVIDPVCGGGRHCKAPWEIEKLRDGRANKLTAQSGSGYYGVD